eukprot:TRINITY_DN3807_c0_g1_i1.p2 TRINITY_DN3807_c0_g1~~TRINITY_DN3807_c0_g1_i1.p2  ORF type:complete len:117 (+),score=33.23 TRINITY_DN3807_c0_g1_i1:257-607(+)
MPHIAITTNQSIDASTTDAFMKQASEVAAKETGKPEKWIMISIQERVSMIMGGTPGPVAAVRISNIGELAKERVAVLAKSLTSLLTSHFKVSGERVYIMFEYPHPSAYAWNGNTFE